MKKCIVSLLCCLLSLLGVLGCNPDAPISVLIDPPKCSIVNVRKTDALWPRPATITITVKNSGDATAYDVECSIELKSGSTIVDEGLIYFGTLRSGESYAQDASFWSISTHHDYATAEYQLYWYDSQGNYHD